MTINEIRNAAKAEPFKPFTVSLADGRRLRVRHPECVYILPEPTRTFIVAESGEDYSIIDMLLVTSIDFGNGANGRSKNGRSRKRH